MCIRSSVKNIWTLANFMKFVVLMNPTVFDQVFKVVGRSRLTFVNRERSSGMKRSTTGVLGPVPTIVL